MKKTLSILLVLVMCVSLMTLPAYAASGSMSASSAEVTPGSSATVTVSINNNPGVMAMQVVPSVPEGFSITLTGTGMGGGVWTTGKNAFWDNASDSTYIGEILTVTVNVGADVVPGTYTIGFSCAGSNYNEEDVSFGSCTATITVKKPACDHVSDGGVVTKAPDCTNAGEKTYTCTVCGEVIKVEAIAALGHTSDGGVVTTEPDCTKAGEKTYTCTVCGEVIKVEAVAALGHKWDEGKVTSEPSCTDKGVKTYTCSVCGETKTEEIPAKGHDYIYTDNKDGKTHTVTCADCDYSKVENHTYGYGDTCICGYKKVADDNGNDDVPKTGDITPYPVFIVIAVAAVMGTAYGFKRKFVK